MKTQKQDYKQPFVREIEMIHGSMLCASNGTTQDYNNQTIWLIGTDNDD
jgi:hypothetical protein